jgi:hypothetical protein
VDLETRRPGSRLDSGLLASLTIGLALALFRSFLPRGVFWITDAGNKFIEVQNFVAGRYRHIAIAYTGATLDPAFRSFPEAGGHFLRRGDSFYSIVPFQFPLLNAPLYEALGPAGVTIIPLASGIGILLVVSSLVRRLDSRLSPGLAVAAVALATPIAFYSLDFWEHTAATLLATIAVFLLLGRTSAPSVLPDERPNLRIGGRQAFFAGIVTGLSIAMREEGYIFLAAVLVAMLGRSRPRALAALCGGTALVVAPLLIAQQRIYGSVLGLHLLAHTAPETAAAAAMRIAHNYAYFLFQMHERPLAAVLLALPVVVAIAIGSSRTIHPAARLASTASVLGGSAIALLALFAERDPIVNTIWTQGLFLFVPLLSFMLADWRRVAGRPDGIGFSTRIVLIYVLAMPLVLHANWTGIVWGPRYFLTVLPLATIVALSAARDLRDAAGTMPRMTVVLTTAAVALSMAFEARGLALLHRKLVATAGLADLLRHEPPVLVTDVFWLPEEMAQLFFEKAILMPANARDLAEVIASMRAHGVTEFSYVTSPRYHGSGPDVIQRIRGLAVRRVRYVSPVSLLTVDVIRCRLAAGPEESPR